MTPSLLKKAKELGLEKTVVTVMSDTGIKYLTTDLYRHAMKTAKEWAGPSR